MSILGIELPENHIIYAPHEIGEVLPYVLMRRKEEVIVTEIMEILDLEESQVPERKSIVNLVKESSGGKKKTRKKNKKTNRRFRKQNRKTRRGNKQTKRINM